MEIQLTCSPPVPVLSDWVIPLQSIIRILPCSFHWHSHPPSDPPHMPPHHVQVKAHSLFYELKNTLYGQKYSLFCLHIHMYLSEIPFLIHKVCCDVSPPFVEQLLWGLFTRFRSVYGSLWGQTLILDEKSNFIFYFHSKPTHPYLFEPSFVLVHSYIGAGRVHPKTHPLSEFSWYDDFTFPTISWLSCCCFQSLAVCYNSTNSWLWNI